MASTPTQASTADWRRSDKNHHIHPFTDNAALQTSAGPRVIVKGEGAWLVDSDGRRILDGMSGLWCVNVGYGRNELAAAAAEQMRQLPYYNTFFKTTTMPAVRLSEKLAELTPDGLNKVFFANSGSEANETILRFVRRYWNLQGKPKKKIFIGRNNAYHGSTTATASLGGMSAMHEMDDLPISGFAHVIQPYWYHEGGDLSLDEFGLVAAKAVEDRILEIGPENVAAFFGEPIQGSGGVIIPPDTYWAEVQRICRKYDVLIVADEVVCGFGRTGEWFGCDYFGIKPDFMTLAKGITSGYLPLSAVMVHDRIAEVIYEKGGGLEHGYTYSGHPTCCAVALANIEILEKEHIVDRVREDTGPYFRARLQELSDHPLIGNIRSAGMIAGFGLVTDKATRSAPAPVGTLSRRCHEICMANDVIVRSPGDSMVMAPPLIISRDEIDILVERYRKSLDQTAVEFGLG